MRYLRRFDPWNGKYCTCKVKYSLAPYTGCDHRCQYCYITTYIPNAFFCRPKTDFIKYLPNDLKKADSSIPVSISNSSDPYPTIEKKFELTRKALKIIAKANFNILLVTKSDIILRDIDLLKGNNIAVTFTINSNDDSLAKRLEPGAPVPSKRLFAVGELINHSVPVMVRVDPIIPGLNEDVEPLMKELRDLGVKLITTSTYKARKDSLTRIIDAFPELDQTLTHKYLDSGEFVNRAWYLPKEDRERIMRNVYECAHKFGLGFNMCREGVSLPRTSQSCDGVHLLER